jgi:hypothetical protein
LVPICDIAQRRPLCGPQFCLDCLLQYKDGSTSASMREMPLQKIIFEQASNLSSGPLHQASRIICSDASKHQEPGPFIIGILKPTHIGHVLIVARQATRDWVPGGGIDPFIHCGMSCGLTRLDITAISIETRPSLSGGCENSDRSQKTTTPVTHFGLLCPVRRLR